MSLRRIISSMIALVLAEDARTALVVYDLLSREVSRMCGNDPESRALLQVEFNGPHLWSGIYLFRLQSRSIPRMQKIELSTQAHCHSETNIIHRPRQQ